MVVFYIIEDFNAPKDQKHLNDSNGKEIFIEEMLIKIKNKEYFKNILSKEDQSYLFENIEKFTFMKEILKAFIFKYSFFKKKND